MFQMFFINFNDPSSNEIATNGVISDLISQKQKNKNEKKFMAFFKGLGSFALVLITFESMNEQLTTLVMC